MPTRHALLTVIGILAIIGPSTQAAPEAALWTIGTPDGTAGEFGLARARWPAYLARFPAPVVYTIGASHATDWPYIHPSTNDRWAGGRAHAFTIRFHLPEPPQGPLFLLLGLADAHANEPSRVTVTVNGRALPSQRAPRGAMRLHEDPGGVGRPATMVFPIPEGLLRRGANAIAIRLDGGSWIIYDYVRLARSPRPPERADPGEALLEDALDGIEEIVFAVRQPGKDGHWYANFSYYAADARRPTYGEGGRLCRLDLRTGALQVLLEDPRGGVRDPQVHYEGERILFSYRPGGEAHYHLYEIRADGTGLRRLTEGPWDDIEPTYLPDGDIIFCSSRCKRWVNCWLTQVAVLYRCDGDGRGIHPISSNGEHDNTPWPLPDGRILYTRWEYVDRSQVLFHHLWTILPDGTGQMVFYGNQHPGTVMIDAKPIPDTDRIVAIFSPGHGRREHAGAVTIVDPGAGPDAQAFARRITGSEDFRDPHPIAPEAFLAARGAQIVALGTRGMPRVLYALPKEDVRAGLACHEPRPLRPRPREPRIPSRIDPGQGTGRMVLVDVYHGRNMRGVERGEIEKLLVLETLPKPINFTGGMEPLSYGGTFTLERILGTVPVEPDGSAYFEVPALRSLFFVALDEENLSVKRMQSFVTVAPGETVSCAGCHEPRSAAPPSRRPLLATRRPPSRIAPIPDAPDVFDFPRDIQPILDRRCARCHDAPDPGGGVVLSGDRGPLYSLSYFELFARNQVADGRNALGNRPPRAIGSSASPLLAKLRGGHPDGASTAREREWVRLWIDSGAPYPGTYAALGTGMIGGYAQNQLDRSDTRWPAMRAAMEALRRRCGTCHVGSRRLPLSPSDDLGRQPWVPLAPDDPRRRYARHRLYNLTHPEKSLILVAPLAGAGETLACTDVFADPRDPDYRAILGGIRAAKERLDAIKRFDMPGFRPHPAYVRELERYGILPSGLDPDSPIDVYTADRAYWRSLWYAPRHAAGSPAG